MSITDLIHLQSLVQKPSQSKSAVNMERHQIIFLLILPAWDAVSRKAEV